MVQERCVNKFRQDVDRPAGVTPAVVYLVYMICLFDYKHTNHCVGKVYNPDGIK